MFVGSPVPIHGKFQSILSGKEHLTVWTGYTAIKALWSCLRRENGSGTHLGRICPFSATVLMIKGQYNLNMLCCHLNSGTFKLSSPLPVLDLSPNWEVAVLSSSLPLAGYGKKWLHVLLSLTTLSCIHLFKGADWS